jgi:hypothetical protein
VQRLDHGVRIGACRFADTHPRISEAHQPENHRDEILIAEPIVVLGQAQYRHRRLALRWRHVDHEGHCRGMVEAVNRLEPRRHLRFGISDAGIAHALDFAKRRCKALGELLIERVLRRFYCLQRPQIPDVRSFGRIEVLGIIAAQLIRKPTARRSSRRILVIVSRRFFAESTLRRNIVDTHQPL